MDATQLVVSFNPLQPSVAYLYLLKTSEYLGRRLVFRNLSHISVFAKMVHYFSKNAPL